MKVGYEIPDNCKLIGNVKSQRLKEAIYDFFASEDNNPDDTLVFYYSGHGVPDRWGAVYFAPSDINTTRPFMTGFSFADLTNSMLACNSLSVVTILDCCYSGSLEISKGLDSKSGEETSTRIANKIVEEKSDKLKQGVGRCLLASSQGYEEAYDRMEKDHSIITYYLLEALNRHKNAVDDEGNVTYDSASRFISRRIGNLPPERRPNQTPIRKGEISGEDIILAHYTKPIEKNTAADKVFIEALECIENEDYIGALSCLNQALELDPKNAKGFFYQGNMSAKLENYQKAKNSYQKALETDPNMRYASVVSSRLAMVTRYIETKEKGDEPAASDIHEKIQKILEAGLRVAIIIGITKYKDLRIPKLPGAEYDAKEIYEILGDPNRGNFKIQSYLAGEDATFNHIRLAISDALYRTDPHDLVLFYFSGHGFVDDYNDGYIAPYDMLLDEPLAYGIRIRELIEVISRSKHKKSLVILDCSYSGIATGDRSPPGPKEDFEKQLDFQNSRIMASIQANQRLKEIEVSHGDLKPHPHGKFTFHLLQGLDGAASDKNTGIITLAKLHEYVEKRMTETGTYQNLIFSLGTEVGPLEKIELAVVPHIWKKNRDILVQEISESCHMDKAIYTLYYAAEKIKDQLPLFDPDNIFLDHFKNSITTSLQQYSGRIANWLDENSITIGSEIGRISPSLYDHLYDFERYLNFDSFVTIDKLDLAYLVALCGVINGSMTPDTFIRRVKKFTY